MQNIYKKLAKVQEEISVIKKGSENPFFKSKYFDINELIETLKPVLHKHELMVVQPLGNVAGRPSVKTIVYDTTSGESMELSEVTLPDNADAQKMGSAVTYFRRYALQSFFFLQAEDDDGNAAKPAPVKKAEKVRTGESADDLPF